MSDSTDKGAAHNPGRPEEAKALADFRNASLEWRRIFAEAWGTFLLVIVAAGAGVSPQ